MSLYSDFANDAKELLAEFGRIQKITLTVMIEGPVDFATGEATQVPDPYEFDAVTIGYKSNEIDGVRVIAGDLRVIAEAGAVVAQVGNTVTIDGVVWRVVSTEPVNPGGVLIVQKWQVRK